MNDQTHISRSALFLMELISAILIFSIAAAVCVRLFARAHTLSEQASEQTGAVRAVTTAAEAVRAAETIEDAFALLSASFEGAAVTVQEAKPEAGPETVAEAGTRAAQASEAGAPAVQVTEAGSPATLTLLLDSGFTAAAADSSGDAEGAAYQLRVEATGDGEGLLSYDIALYRADAIADSTAIGEGTDGEAAGESAAAETTGEDTAVFRLSPVLRYTGA